MRTWRTTSLSPSKRSVRSTSAGPARVDERSRNTRAGFSRWSSRNATSPSSSIVTRTASVSTARRTSLIVAILGAFPAGAAAPRTSAATPAANKIDAATSSAQLRIDFIEVVLVHQHLTRLSAGGRRDEPFHLHHVDEP